MTEFYARKDYIYNGDSRIFTIPFPLIDTRFIRVYVNGVSSSWLKLNDSQLQVADWVTLTAGDIISIRRETPIDEQMVIFSDKSILNEENQNLAQQQLFYSMQELYDNNTQFKEDVENVLDSTVTELTNTVNSFKTDIEETINTGDTNLQTQFNNFKSTVNLTAERIDLIDTSVVTSVNKAEIAKEYAQAAKTSSDNAKLYSDNALESSTNATAKVVEATTQCNNMISEIGEEKTSALQEITNAKNSAISDIVEAAAPSADALKNYYTKYEIDGKGFLTSHQDISGKVDKVAGKDLSSNDYTTAEKLKLEGLENYTLPIATTEILGGIKIDGETLTIDSGGVVSAITNNTGGGIYGSMCYSMLPLVDDRLHLTDGSVLTADNYSDFINEIDTIYHSKDEILYAWTAHPMLNDTQTIYTKTKTITSSTSLYNEKGEAYLKTSGDRFYINSNNEIIFTESYNFESTAEYNETKNVTLSNPPDCFTTELDWMFDETKFVYDSDAQTVRLPKISVKISDSLNFYSYIRVK